MDEVDRIWDTTTKFDEKVLQFAGVIAAGFLAGAGLAGDRLSNHAKQPPPVLILLLVASPLVFVFWGMRRDCRQ